MTAEARRGLPAVALNQILKPALRAYAFGHISTTGPKLIGLLLALTAGRRNLQRHVEKLKYITRSSLGLFRFPFFSATLVGLYSALSLVFISAARRQAASRSPSAPATLGIAQIRTARLLAALIAAYATFPMLNRGDARVVRRRAVSDVPIDPTIAHLAADPQFAAAGHPNAAAASVTATAGGSNSGNSNDNRVGARYSPGGKPPPPLAGRTMDLTVMAVVRAAETLVWHWWRRRYGSKPSSRTARALAASSDAGLFIGSCFVIMWSWFFSPLTMPASYRRWIGQAAGVDARLVEVLRKARWGTFVYGVDTGQGYILEAMCRDYGWPLAWGEPATTAPVPCEMVHQGAGPSCHRHAAVKFARVWAFAMRMYLPLQLAVRMRGVYVAATATGSRRLHGRNLDFLRAVLLPALRRAALEAGRSSAFLAAFVSLFYYGVCLSRTLVGPRLFPRVGAQAWDSGLCVGTGSALCGWSVLLEPARRRQELALFVAPRAASCLLPARYDRRYLPRERAAFAGATAVLFALAHDDPANVRGILGFLVHSVIG